MSMSVDFNKTGIILQTKQKERMKNNFDNFHQEIQLAPDEALVLSNPNQIDFPEPTEITQTVFSTLASLVTFSKIKNSSPPNKQFLPIPNQLFLMVYGNVIRVVRHYRSIQQQPECEILTEIELQFYIKCVKISPFSRSTKDKDIVVLVEDSSSNYLQTLQLDVSDKSIKPISTLRTPSTINCWAFVHNRQILIWAKNMKIYHYEVSNNGLKLIQSLDTGININAEVFVEKQEASRSRSKSKGLSQPKQTKKQKKKSPFVLNYCEILGQRGKSQDSIIVLFYVLYNEEFNGMKIKCKQILYPFETSQATKSYQFFAGYGCNQFPKLRIQPETHEIVSHNTASPEILHAISIVKIEEAFLIRFQFEIIVVQKKFNQEYMVINNIYKKNKGCKVSMAYNSNIVTVITNNILELNKIEIVDNKIQTTMIDFIDLENQFQIFKSFFLQALDKDTKQKSQIQWLKEKNKLLILWITTDLLHEQHRNQINFVFEASFRQKDEEKQAYFLFNSKHVPRVKKLTALAHKAQKPEDVKSIEQLGKNLGINEAQFYYNMWKTSKHTYDDVLMYLLRSKDYIKIISQLKGFLRKRSYAATKLQKVLLKLEDMTLQLLQEKLSEQHLMDYFHIMFVNKKFQIYESNYEIDEREFIETVQISIYDLFKKIINQTLFPITKSESVWAAEPKKPPKLNLIQVLGYFKLPLLEDYDIFLEKILREYPLSIVKVIENFPELLPNYPFEDLTSVAENAPAILTTRSNSFQSSKPNEKQKQFFSPIKNEHIKVEPNFLDNILEKLYSFYSTSLIKKSFDQVLSRPQIKNKKFITHSIIATSKENYKNKLKILSTKNPIYLYNVALDCLIKIGQNADEEDLYYKYKKIAQLCQVFRQFHKIEESLVEEMEIMASFFQLMIFHEMLQPNQFTLNDFISQPIEKWIALFFLGNKQQKDLIFKEFMNIYIEKKSEDKFIKALKQFIESEHCSKIQLCILIDLINHMGPEFQKKNQKIIDLIVVGFCSRVQISDIADATNFKQRLCKIQLGQQLLLKADKIEKMSICRYILSNFYLENTLIKDLLENTLDVLNMILEKWFQNEMKDSEEIKFGTTKKSFSIEIKEIMDMFRLLHFLRENVFYNLEAEQLVKLFCKKLIFWQRFDQIHQLLYNSEDIRQYDIDLPKVVSEIQADTLEEIQKVEDFMFTEENKKFIKKILEIDRDPAKNVTVMKMKARIAISDIFLGWKIAVKSSQLQEMCRQWEKIANEVSTDNPLGIKQHDIMDEIIETYAEHLNVKSLEQLYKHFLIAVTNNPNPDTKTERFYRYCTSLCDALLTHRRYKEASEIICIVNQMFEMNYQLMAECMLQSVCSIYLNTKAQAHSRLDIINNSVISSLTEEKIRETPKNQSQQKQNGQKTPIGKYFGGMLFPNEMINSQENSEQVEEQLGPIEVAKLYVHYFVINWIENDEEGMNKMYHTYFDVELQTIPTLLEIQVHSDLCFNQLSAKINTHVLWEVVKKAFQKAQNSHPVSEERLIYCYFFIVMGLFQPDIGFTLIDYINYNHKTLVNFLTQIMKLCEESQKELLFLDYSVIFKKYLDSLTKLLILKYQETNPNEDENLQTSSEKTEAKQVKNLMDLSVHNLKSDNLSIIREQFLKNGEYKDQPLITYITQMRILTQEAEKSCKKRAILYNNKSVKAFSLTGNQNKLKMTMRKNQKNIEKQPQNNEKSKKNQQDHMMSFQQFKEVKRKIKDRSHNEIIDVDISERLIVENLFDQIDPSKRKIKTTKEIPELEEIIQNSLKELEEREKKQKSQIDISEDSVGFGHPEQEKSHMEEQAQKQAAVEEANRKDAANKSSNLFFSFKGGFRS